MNRDYPSSEVRIITGDLFYHFVTNRQNCNEGYTLIEIIMLIIYMSILCLYILYIPTV